MQLFKIFSSSEKSREKENEKKCIIQGYPLSPTPIPHDNLKHSVEFKPLKTATGSVRLGITYAHEGVDLVNAESLEMIRQRLHTWFGFCPVLTAQFATKLPCNILAISYSMTNFIVGKSCQEFKLVPRFEKSKNGYFTYRKLSESVQCTYYNENGVEYLAGICYYPTPHGKSKLLESNKALLGIASLGINPYPLQDRIQSHCYTKYGYYGRFCEDAQKWVLVSMNGKDKIPRHADFDHEAKYYKTTLCKDCLKDYFTYKWEEPVEPKEVAEPVEESSMAPSMSPEDFENVDFFFDFENVELNEQPRHCESDIEWIE